MALLTLPESEEEEEKKMKGLSGGGGDVFKSTTLIKILAFTLLSIAFFYFGKHWSDGSQQQQLIFFNSRQNPTTSQFVSISPNFNKTFDLSSIINDTNLIPPPAVEVASSPPPPPPPPPVVERTGIVNENGVMNDEFKVGDFDPEVVENWGVGNETVDDEGSGVHRFRVKKFGLCPASMREYIPCLDNVEAIRKLKSTERGEKFERHCPEKGKGLNCLVPPPRGYRAPIPWPRSRDEVCVIFC